MTYASNCSKPASRYRMRCMSQARSYTLWLQGSSDDYLMYAAYIALVPLAVFHEGKMARERKLQKQIPDFLGRMASTNETGMTIRDSIKLMAKSYNGAISKQIKLIWKDIDWGLDVNDALTRFANRIRTHVVARSITLITKANESSGDVGEVLSVAARDAETEQTLRKERAMNMMIYIVIIYISFLVFVGVIYVITDSFLSRMAAASLVFLTLIHSSGCSSMHHCSRVSAPD